MKTLLVLLLIGIFLTFVIPVARAGLDRLSFEGYVRDLDKGFTVVVVYDKVANRDCYIARVEMNMSRSSELKMECFDSHK